MPSRAIHLPDLKNRNGTRWRIPVCRDYKKKPFAVIGLTKDSTFLTMEEIEKVYKAEVPVNLEPILDMFAARS